MTEKTEKKWFHVTFSALVEANDETHASSIAWNAAEVIDEHIGSLCDGDPLIHRVAAGDVAAFNGKLPWEEEEEALEKAGFSAPSTGVMAAEEARVYLHGLLKGSGR